MEPYVAELENLAIDNTSFRRVLFTTGHAQLVVMSLAPGEDIGTEEHRDVDQFFRIEQGAARFVFGPGDERQVAAGGAVVVPAGQQHNVVNASDSEPLKLYTLYAPPNHPPATVHTTKADAIAAEASHE